MLSGAPPRRLLLLMEGCNSGEGASARVKQDEQGNEVIKDEIAAGPVIVGHLQWRGGVGDDML